MKTIIIALLTALCPIISFAQKIDAAKVPSAVISAFTTKYPSITDPKWEIEKPGIYEVNFSNHEVKQSSVFDKSGKWLETETTIPSAELPKPVTENLQKDYPGFVIKEAEAIEKPTTDVLYEVEISKGSKRYELKYNAAGAILKKTDESKKK